MGEEVKANSKGLVMMREFVPSPKAIQTQSAIDITAPPEYVAAIYRNVEKWGETFPATIERARVIEQGENWAQIEVIHRQEGHVPNTLIFLSDTVIALEESKKKFNASFLNEFNAKPDGTTRYVITSYVTPKGIYKLLKPFLQSYVHKQALKQMKNYVLEPLKRIAERNVQPSAVV
jgi:hypothetical protein